jgi:hypothetical protein
MIGLFMLIESAISADPAIQRRIDQAPKPVREFIERRAGCNYFAGEEPYDKERARDLANKARSLRCAALERDERTLRRLFAKQRDVLDLLSITQDVIY